MNALVPEGLPDSDDPIEPLGGGIANAGSVFRQGSVVFRPKRPQTGSVQDLMARWRRVGITEVPEPLGTTDDGWELCRYIEGRSATASDDWASSEEILAAVATMQHRLHRAAARFDPDDEAGPWGGDGYIPVDFLPPAASGPVFACHNDLCIPNLVFASDSATVVGVIDWDYARPVDPLFDISVAMRHWVPFSEPADRSGAWGEVATGERFAHWAGIAELTSSQQKRVLDIAIVFLDRAHINIADLAARNIGGFRQLVDDGYLDRNRRDRAWIVRNRASLLEASRGS